MLQYKIKYIVLRNSIRGTSAVEIASSIERALDAGKLSVDVRLPTIRELAKSLNVSPVTVASAYRLLRSRGLAVGQGRRGTTLNVQRTIPAPAIRSTRSLEGLVDLATGNPDPTLLPPMGAALRALEPDMRLYGGSDELPALVAFAASEFEADGVSPGPIAITNGGLDAIERVLREHTRTGDHVAIEDPTFPALPDLLAALGLVPVPFTIDDEGPIPESLDRAVGPRAAAMVVSTRAQNPTGAVISERRARSLVHILRRRPPLLVIEIDEAGPVAGSAAISLTTGRERWAVVKSTSKWLGPDLRVAVITGDRSTIARVQRRQAVSVRWVSHVLQRLTLALWSDPSSGRLFARATEAYAERRQALIGALAAFEIRAHGRSGFNVWIPVREETATVQALAARGWAVAAGERFRIHSPPALRVTTSALLPAEAKRFAGDLAAARHPRSPAPA
jgi:DNA-binding transcriptional MocR family regulator